MAASEPKAAIACVVLAAGHSQRFGARKVLAELANGQTMLQTVIETYQQVFEQVSVVAGDDLRELIEGNDAQFIASPRSHMGLSQSLIAGVEAHLTAPAVMIGLADMPYLSATTIRSLVAAAKHDALVVPEYQSKRGNPVVLGRAFYAEVLKLRGDKGAKVLLQAHAERVVRVPVNDFAVCHDIDTPDDILLAQS